MSARTSTSEVSTAVYAKLTGDATLMALLATPLVGSYSVFDFGAVPENQPFPYITIGDVTEQPLNAFGRRGYVSRHKIHIWDSQFGGFKNSQTILARLNTLLDQQILTLASQTMVYFLYQQSIPMNDPGDNHILHTSVEYESFAQE